MRKFILAAVCALALIAAVPAALALTNITKGTAASKASGFQHWACGSVSGYTCLNWNLFPPNCHGPTGGAIQWTCDGTTQERAYGNVVFCAVESSWSAYGKLVHWYRASAHDSCS